MAPPPPAAVATIPAAGRNASTAGLIAELLLPLATCMVRKSDRPAPAICPCATAAVLGLKMAVYWGCASFWCSCKVAFAFSGAWCRQYARSSCRLSLETVCVRVRIYMRGMLPCDVCAQKGNLAPDYQSLHPCMAATSRLHPAAGWWTRPTQAHAPLPIALTYMQDASQPRDLTATPHGTHAHIQLAPIPYTTLTTQHKQT